MLRASRLKRRIAEWVAACLWAIPWAALAQGFFREDDYFTPAEMFFLAIVSSIVAGIFSSLQKIPNSQLEIRTVTFQVFKDAGAGLVAGMTSFAAALTMKLDWPAQWAMVMIGGWLGASLMERAANNKTLDKFFPRKPPPRVERRKDPEERNLPNNVDIERRVNPPVTRKAVQKVKAKERNDEDKREDQSPYRN